MNYTESIYNRVKEAEERFTDLMRNEYADFYKAGYKFCTNDIVAKKEECINRLKAQGLDFVIGERAFDIVGRKHPPSMIAFFIKEKVKF